MAIKDFKQLHIYQRGFKNAMTIFEASKQWPKHERYALTDQIRRSSRSVCSNIAEAWFKRQYQNHFVSKLSDTSTEAAETLVWLDFAVKCGYLSEHDRHNLSEAYRSIIGGLVKMMTEPEKWCGIANRVHEGYADYSANS